MTRSGRTLRAMYEAMRSAFGHRGWWPSRAGQHTPDGKLEICIGAILTQNTNWRNVEKALDNLRSTDALSLDRLKAMTHDELADLIRPAGYFNVKARRLKHFIRAVFDQAGGDIERFLSRPIIPLREALLGVNGIGPETADSMILYAAGRASFVVDAYTVRVFRRHHLIDAAADYAAIQQLCEQALPGDVELYNDYHAQLVEVGKQHCRPRARCGGCPLERFPHDPLA